MNLFQTPPLKLFSLLIFLFRGQFLARSQSSKRREKEKLNGLTLSVLQCDAINELRIKLKHVWFLHYTHCFALRSTMFPVFLWINETLLDLLCIRSHPTTGADHLFGFCMSKGGFLSSLTLNYLTVTSVFSSYYISKK